jgi:DNA repair protein RadC
MLRANLAHKCNEVLFALFLNAKNKILPIKELGEGTVAQASAFPRKIVEEGLKLRATSLIFAHNHPGGVAEPSGPDIAMTQEKSKALALVDITLQEHMILAGADYYSFRRDGLL